MPSLNNVVTGSSADSSCIQQIVDAWKGTPNLGVPLSVTAVDDATNWAGDFKNLSTSTQRSFRVRDAADVTRFSIDSSGVMANSTGVGLALVITRADNNVIGSSMLSTGAATTFVSNSQAGTINVSSGASYTTVGLEHTVTTLGKTVLVQGSGPIRGDAVGQIVSVGISQDGSGYTPVWSQVCPSSGIMMWSFMYTAAPSAGSHTWKLGMAGNTSSVHMDCGTVAPVITVTEWRR